jgi:DNA-directed RNA polymerase subunit N
MLIPVRCFSCGKPIGHLWEDYKERVGKGESAEKVLDKLGLERYCCRRMFLSHKDYIDEVVKYKWR